LWILQRTANTYINKKDKHIFDFNQQASIIYSFLTSTSSPSEVFSLSEVRTLFFLFAFVYNDFYSSCLSADKHLNDKSVLSSGGIPAQALSKFSIAYLYLYKEFMTGVFLLVNGAFIKYPRVVRTASKHEYYYISSLFHFTLYISSERIIKSMIIGAARRESSQTL